MALALARLRGDWAAVSALLDEALAEAPAARVAWLAALQGERAAHRETLAALLAGSGAVETSDFLGTLPRFGAPDEGQAALALEGLAPGLEVGPYRLLAEIGRGGMGTVFLAERSDGQPRRKVALKLPHIGWEPGLAARLERERDILAALEHPYIARLYDAGLDALGRPFLALEYVDGTPIDRYVAEHALPVRARIELVLQVCAAVAHAHARLVVHRDLKPANILVTEAGEVRLLDFGIARLALPDAPAESALTRESGRALTPEYASPEQLRGETLGTASDVYSLGVVAYELLAGTRPQRRKGTGATAAHAAITAGDLPLASETTPDSALRRELQGDLDAILQQALREDPAQRYASVAALALDLERYRHGEPVLARADSRLYRLRKFALRNRLAVSATSIVALAVASGAGLALWQASVARDQARIAIQQAGVALTESRRAQAVQGFLLDIFKANSDQQADPASARNTTARELLDLGAARLESSLRDAPEARVEVLQTLGEMYYELQLDEQAAALETKRIELLRRLHGANDRRIAEALVAFASSLHGSSRRDEILPALEEARRILDASGDRTSTLRGELLTTLAQRHQNLSYEKMKAYADEAVSVLRPLSSLGKDSLSTALHLAARARVQLGEPAAGEPLYRESLAELAKSRPLPQLALLQGRTSLAECLAAQQKFDAAIATYRAAAADALAAFGPTDPGSIVAQSRLAALLHATGQRAEARSLHQEALRRVLHIKGADDTLYTPIVRMDFGRSLLAEGRLGEALEQVAAVNASNRRHYAGSAVLGNGLRVEATILVAMGRFDEARRLFAEGFGLWRGGSGSAMRPWRHNRFHLDEAALDLALHDAPAAIARLQQVASPSGTESLPLNSEEIERDILLAQARVQLGDAGRALPLAEAAVDRLTASSLRAQFGALEADAQLQFGRTLLSAGRRDDARSPIESALAWRSANDNALSPWLADAEVAWAGYQLAAGEPTRARTSARHAASIEAAQPALGKQFVQPLRELQIALKQL